MNIRDFNIAQALKQKKKKALKFSKIMAKELSKWRTSCHARMYRGTKEKPVPLKPRGVGD